jgi:hypothetical protein
MLGKGALADHPGVSKIFPGSGVDGHKELREKWLYVRFVKPYPGDKDSAMGTASDTTKGKISRMG